MSKASDLNEQIALHFGFKKGQPLKPGLVSGKRYHQWTYPQDWYTPQCSVPNFDIPDFISMIEDYLRLVKVHGGYGKIEDFGRFGNEE